MGRFRIHLLLDDNTWSTRYNLPENDRYSTCTNDWNLVGLYPIVENCGMKLLYHQRDTALADLSFSNITVTHSIY